MNIQNEKSIREGFIFKGSTDDQFYTVIKELQPGSQAQVFLVKDDKDNKQKVIKMVDKSINKLETLREIELLKKVKGDCSYVIEYFDDFPYALIKQCIVTEFLEQGDLERLIDKYKSDNNEFLPERISYWAVQLLKGIKFLHSNNIIHRDIKPKNIFLSGIADVKLGDLGYSKSVEHMSETKSKIVGTSSYMSPEIVLRHPNYDNKIDIWSFGCVFYELITLKKLFNGSSEYEIQHQIVNDSTKLLNIEQIQLTSDKFREVLTNSLKHEPKERSTADDLLNILTNTNSSQSFPKKTTTTQSIVKAPSAHLKNNRYSDDLDDLENNRHVQKPRSNSLPKKTTTTQSIVQAPSAHLKNNRYSDDLDLQTLPESVKDRYLAKIFEQALSAHLENKRHVQNPSLLDITTSLLISPFSRQSFGLGSVEIIDNDLRQIALNKTRDQIQKLFNTKQSPPY